MAVFLVKEMEIAQIGLPLQRPVKVMATVKPRQRLKKTDKVGPRFCLPEGPHYGVYNSEMIQCHLGHHYECAWINADDVEHVVVWTCKKCRCLPVLVTELVNKIDSLNCKVEQLIVENIILLKTNVELKSLIENKYQSQAPTRGIKPSSSETLLIGSSLVKTVTDDFELERTKVVDISGGCVPDVESILIKETETTDMRTFACCWWK